MLSSFHFLLEGKGEPNQKTKTAQTKPNKNPKHTHTHTKRKIKRLRISRTSTQIRKESTHTTSDKGITTDAVVMRHQWSWMDNIMPTNMTLVFIRRHNCNLIQAEIDACNLKS